MDAAERAKFEMKHGRQHAPLVFSMSGYYHWVGGPDRLPLSWQQGTAPAVKARWAAAAAAAEEMAVVALLLRSTLHPIGSNRLATPSNEVLRLQVPVCPASESFRKELECCARFGVTG